MKSSGTSVLIYNCTTHPRLNYRLHVSFRVLNRLEKDLNPGPTLRHGILWRKAAALPFELTHLFTNVFHSFLKFVFQIAVAKAHGEEGKKNVDKAKLVIERARESLKVCLHFMT